LDVAIQLGLVGAGLLYAMWISHLLLFSRRSFIGLPAWLGFALVVQNMVSGLFNAYLFEFTLGWLYVFGVGVLGGMVLRPQGAAAARGGGPQSRPNPPQGPGVTAVGATAEAGFSRHRNSLRCTEISGPGRSRSIRARTSGRLRYRSSPNRSGSRLRNKDIVSRT